MQALVTGATGFIGRSLISRLETPRVLVRDVDKAVRRLGDVRAFPWRAGDAVPTEALEGVDVVFHLAGAPVAQRWTPRARKAIAESRVHGTESMVRSMEQMGTPPRVLISASAVGYYGSRGEEVLDESSPPGEGFLADVCVAWEDAAKPAADLGVRVVSPRIGVVLGVGGGALEKMEPMFRLGFGGRLGDGKQWWPWVHIDDVVDILLWAAREESVAGPVNAVAPEAVTNTDFTRALARALRRPAVLPAPKFALRALLGEMSEALLGSARVVPRRLLEAEFPFRYPQVLAALEACLG